MVPPETPESEFLEWLRKLHSVPCRFHLEGSAVNVSAQRADAFLSTIKTGISWPMPEVDHELCKALGARYGADPDGIVIAPNASTALHVVCRALVHPGDGVLVEEPTYDPFLVAPLLRTDRVGTFARDLLARPEDLARKLDQLERPRLMILSDLHNPTGDQIREETFTALAELAAEYQLTIVVDEVFRDLAPPYETFPTPAGTRDPRLISLNSFSKTYGWNGVFKCGWMIADPSLAEKLRRAGQNLYNALSPIDLRLGILALPDLEAHRAESVRHTAANREIVRTHLDPLIRDGILRCEIASHGSTCFPTIQRVDDANVAIDALEAAGVRVAPGRFFGDPRSFRLGYGGDAELLSAGLETLSATLRGL